MKHTFNISQRASSRGRGQSLAAFSFSNGVMMVAKKGIKESNVGEESSLPHNCDRGYDLGIWGPCDIGKIMYCDVKSCISIGCAPRVDHIY